MDGLNVVIYRKGECIPELKHPWDTCMVKFINGVLCVHIMVHHPSAELKAKVMPSENSLQMSLFTKNDVITFAVKIGETGWQDAPFTAHLECKEDLPAMDTCALPVSMILADCSCGEILDMRFFTLPEEFTKKLLSDMEVQLSKSFDKAAYAENVQNIQRLYSPSQIGSKMKQVMYRIRK